MVLLGEMRQCVRMRFTFTRPTSSAGGGGRVRRARRVRRKPLRDANSELNRPARGIVLEIHVQGACQVREALLKKFGLHRPPSFEDLEAA